MSERSLPYRNHHYHQCLVVGQFFCASVDWHSYFGPLLVCRRSARGVAVELVVSLSHCGHWVSVGDWVQLEEEAYCLPIPH